MIKKVLETQDGEEGELKPAFMSIISSVDFRLICERQLPSCQNWFLKSRFGVI